MDGISMYENGDAGNKRENGSSWPPLHAHLQHRRSKSASERSLDVSRGKGLPPTTKNIYESQILRLSTRTRTALTPLRDYPKSIIKNASTNHRASLEKDIELLQLQLQQEKSMRLMLERAMGRASSTLSPGHRHFATQTKELITEIELLEEEVANQEKHVLSLYRNMFESCVSQVPSEYSSEAASPAHKKYVSRKHPSIISSSFCSSKNFPLRPFQGIISASEAEKRNSKGSDASLFGRKSDLHFEKTRFARTKDHATVPTMGKVSVLRTLKDHLLHCPSNLSEEMVRCMAAVYCCLHNAASAATGNNRPPLLSGPSANVIIPQHGIEESDCSCKSKLEISWISTDKIQFSRASYYINSYRGLVDQLQRVNLNEMESKAQIAFWINVYNSLVMHAYLAHGIPHGSFKRFALFHKAAYNIGGHFISANAIEQSIFCFRAPRIGRWLETILSNAMRKRSSEEKQLISAKFGLSSPQPLACFALCTGAFSDPVLKVYTAENIQEELEAAKREFLQAHIVVKKSRKVFLPKLLEKFAKEASLGSNDLLSWVTENVDKKLRDSIQKCIDRKSNKKGSQIIEWVPYNSKFQYVLSKELTE